MVQTTESGWQCVEPDNMENSRQIHDVENQRVCLCIGCEDEGKGGGSKSCNLSTVEMVVLFLGKKSK